MFVRFVVSAVDEDSGRRQGLFHTAYALRRSGELPLHLHEQLDEALNWLDDKVGIPDRLTRGNRKHANGMAISWFKDTARDCIRQMHTICRLLDEHGIPTEMITSERPGYIVFEDRCQISAVPFSDTVT
jgi:hypothetical protein